VLFVTEGLDALLAVDVLRAQLEAALGGELVSLVDPRAPRAKGTLWVGLGESFVVLRVSPPGRPDAFRQLPRDQLGADPTAAIVRAVVELFWVDGFSRFDAGEIQDPFCPPGLICLDAGRRSAWPPHPEVEVLDPWDTSYRRFYGWDPFVYRFPPSAALTAPFPGREVRGRGYPAPPPYGVRLTRTAEPSESRPPPDDFTLSFLAGAGVHGGGAFLRYEVDALRRFGAFDFGLGYIASRGQPEPLQSARRAITALLLRRFVAEAFELDLGASFGTFFATFESRDVVVRPYLRAMVVFAVPVGRVFDLLVQSDLATTFASVPETGPVEYALSTGLRHRM
jgi:hypothetical protein